VVDEQGWRRDHDRDDWLVLRKKVRKKIWEGLTEKEDKREKMRKKAEEMNKKDREDMIEREDEWESIFLLMANS